MKVAKNKTLGTLLSVILASTLFVSACSETKEVKVTEKVNNDAVTTPVDTDKDVNVDVHVDQPATATRETEVTNVVVDKTNTTKLNNDVANVNANLQKLQTQIKTANEQTKAQLNKQIQQMNAEKQKLQQQIATFEVKNRELNQAAQQQKANMDTLSQETEKTKQEYIKLTEAKLDDFEKKMDTVRDKANNLEDSERAKVDQEITRIEDNRNNVNDKISELNTVNDPASFKNVRNEIDKMVAELERDYSRLVAERISLR